MSTLSVRSEIFLKRSKSYLKKNTAEDVEVKHIYRKVFICIFYKDAYILM